VFRSWEIDFDARAMRIEFLNGHVIEEPMRSAVPPGFSVRRSRIDLGRRVLFLTLDDGQGLEVMAELAAATNPDLAPSSGK